MIPAILPFDPTLLVVAFLFALLLLAGRKAGHRIIGDARHNATMRRYE